MVAFAASNAGPAVMRFTQILKVYTRLRYIGVNYGEKLDKYLSDIGLIFNDSETDKDKINDIRMKEGSYGGKVSRYRVFAEPFSTLKWKVYAYFGTFLMNFIAVMMTRKIQKNALISKKIAKKLKIIAIVRHIHFMLFNMVLINGAFFSSRVIAHIKVIE